MNIKTQAFKRCEIELFSQKTYENPFMDVDINAVFTFEDGTEIKLPGFWNGENQWKVRFSSEKAGKWTYKITCSDAENTSLFDEGIIEVDPCLNPKTEIEKHGYVKLAPGKKYMVYGDGTPFFYLGDTHWMMPDFERLHECNYPGCNCGNQFKHLADDRIKKGFNVYQAYFQSERWEKKASGIEGWWTDSTRTVINPKAFNDTMDIMMEYLAENGITVALGFGTHASTTNAFGLNATPMKAFAKYCVARYACYPLIWITAQEITMTESCFNCWKQVGATVSEYDGYNRPNGAHMFVHNFDSKEVQALDKEPWHQWWTVQAGHVKYNGIQPRSFYEGYYKDDKMFIETECEYEDIYCGAFCEHDVTRNCLWHAVQCGSSGITYGVTGVWVLGWHQKYDPALKSYSPESWFTGIDKPGSEQVGYMKKFYEYVKWYELEPVFDYSFGQFEDRRHVSISHKGNDVVIYYFFSKMMETGYLADLKPSTVYQVRWFDPITGHFIDREDIVTDKDGTHKIPEFPSRRDWVLLINTKDIDLGPYESHEYPKMNPTIPPTLATPGEEVVIKAIKASSEDEDFPATNLIDGNDETYWQGFACKTSQTLTLDLGQMKHFDYLYLRCKDTMRFVQIRIWGSNDGENFDFLCERTSGQIAIGGKWDEYYDRTSGDYRYVRLFISSDASLSEPLKLTRIALFTEAEKN